MRAELRTPRSEVAETLQIGMKVRTKFGVGTVHSIVGDGVSVVLSTGGLLLRCSQAEIDPIDQAKAVVTKATAVRHAPSATGAATRAIEALRFGIVPRDALEETT